MVKQVYNKYVIIIYMNKMYYCIILLLYKWTANAFVVDYKVRIKSLFCGLVEAIVLYFEVINSVLYIGGGPQTTSCVL